VRGLDDWPSYTIGAIKNGYLALLFKIFVLKAITTGLKNNNI